MDKCSFCEKVNFYHHIDELSKNSEISQSYTVALVQITAYKGKCRGRTVCYKKNGRGFPLKFCPECGRKWE